MKILWASVLALMMILSIGCASRPEMHSSLNYEQVKPYLGTGPNNVTGQAFLKQKEGGVVTCAGSGVLLVPDTPYFREVLDNIAHRRTTFEESKINEYAKQGQCDAQGNFVFDKVPNGTWLVVTSVTWADQGGLLIRSWTLPAGTPGKVILTDNDLVK